VTLLHPDTEYTVSVAALNQFGAGLPATATVRTLPHGVGTFSAASEVQTLFVCYSLLLRSASIIFQPPPFVCQSNYFCTSNSLYFGRTSNRPIGRITHLARPSVGLFVTYELLTRKQIGVEKLELVYTFHRARVIDLPIFLVLKVRVKVTKR